MKKLIAVLKVVIIVLLTSILLVLSYIAYNMYSGYKAASEGQVPSEIEFQGEKTEEAHKINILLVGSDARSKEELGRADTLMVAQYDTETKIPKLVSIMRDAYVEIPGYWPDKINAAYSYGGPELMRETLSDNLGLTLEYYVTLTFADFTNIIDDLFPEGVEINSEKLLTVDDDTIQQGVQKMDGQTLLQYVRFRKDEEGDFGRIRRQNQAMGELAKQAQDMTTLARLPKVIGKTLGALDTNLTIKTLTNISKDFILGTTKELEHLSIPVEDTWSFDDYTEAGSVIRLDLVENSRQLHDFLND